MFDLENIKDPSFVKSLSMKELKVLASEIRSFLIESLSHTGGHLSSNLGVVEITIAMYYVFDPEEVSFLFDVGHQCYTHKILTGRAKEFKTLRQYDGMSGYINKNESKYDIWESGHSSTSISAMSGIMCASDRRCVALIGDSSIMNGVALEGLNFLGQMEKKNPIIILNDNKMGISKSVGAMSNAFAKLRGTKFHRGLKRGLTAIFPQWLVHFCHRWKRSVKAFIQTDNIFEDMGFDYYGPYDGNDIEAVIRVLSRIRNVSKEPVILHLNTIKGKGYAPSEQDKSGDFHGVGPFDIETGKPLSNNPNSKSYSRLVADYLMEKRKNIEFKVINPATMAGAQLNEFAASHPEDFYDVGIAEEHAAVMAAGMALEKKDCVLLMYSTFAQRAYDEILNDIARQDLKVIIGIDRAGIVGEDGPTHQGVYDVSMFMEMPNIVVTMPKDDLETIGLFNYAFTQNHPMVIRYPRAKFDSRELDYSYTCDLSWEVLKQGKKAILVGYGPDVVRLESIATKNNLDVMVVNARSLKPVDTAMMREIFSLGVPIVAYEQNIASGTLYHKLLEFKEENQFTSKVKLHGFKPDTLIKHGSLKDVYAHYGLSDEDLFNSIREVIE